MIKAPADPNKHQGKIVALLQVVAGFNPLSATAEH